MKNNLDLEKMVINTINEGLQDAITARLKQGYGDSPLNKLIDSVVASRQGEIRCFIESALDSVLKGDLHSQFQEALAHKMARILVSKSEGEMEKAINELKSNPETRAKMTILVSEGIKQLTEDIKTNLIKK